MFYVSDYISVTLLFTVRMNTPCDKKLVRVGCGFKILLVFLFCEFMQSTNFKAKIITLADVTFTSEIKKITITYCKIHNFQKTEDRNRKLCKKKSYRACVLSMWLKKLIFLEVYVTEHLQK